LALLSEKTPDHRDGVIALLENQTAGYEAGSPLVVIRAVLAAIRGNIFLGNTIDDGADS
jgi:hypothetical protein